MEEKIKQIPELSRELFLVLLIVLVGVGGFGLGRLSVAEEGHQSLKLTQGAALSTAFVGTSSPVKPGQGRVLPAPPVPHAVSRSLGMYVASRTGKKYHLPSCAGAGRIREENKIWFASKKEAEERGYSPAANCPGI